MDIRLPKIYLNIAFAALLLIASPICAQTAPNFCPPDCPPTNPTGAPNNAPNQQSGTRGTSVGVTIDVNSAINLLSKAAKARKEKREREAKERADAEAARAAAAATPSVTSEPKTKTEQTTAISNITQTNATKAQSGPTPVKVNFGAPRSIPTQTPPTMVKVDLSGNTKTRPKQAAIQNQVTTKLVSKPVPKSNTIVKAKTIEPKTANPIISQRPKQAQIILEEIKPAEPIILANPNSRITVADTQNINIATSAINTPQKNGQEMALWLAIATAVGASIFGVAKLKKKPNEEKTENKSIVAKGVLEKIVIDAPIFDNKNAMQIGFLSNPVKLKSQLIFND